MEQTIKIEVPDGKEAIWNKSTNTIEFVDKKLLRSKSWEEFRKKHPRILYNEYYLSATGPNKTYCEGDYRRDTDRGYLSNKEDAEGICALIQLTRLHDEWVGNWKQDYVIENPVWCIKNGVDEISIIQLYSINCLLSFPNEEMAKEFLKCFKNLIETAKRFI